MDDGSFSFELPLSPLLLPSLYFIPWFEFLLLLSFFTRYLFHFFVTVSCIALGKTRWNFRFPGGRVTDNKNGKIKEKERK